MVKKKKIENQYVVVNVDIVAGHHKEMNIWEILYIYQTANIADKCNAQASTGLHG